LKNPELITVVPVYNESANLERVVAEWTDCFKAEGADYVMILLNDGSSDNSGQVLANLAALHGETLRIVNKPNSGHGRTCRMGYEMALETGAPWIFQIDSDGQCDPAHFHDFWRAQDSFDCIYGVRKMRDDGRGRVFVSLCCRMLTWLVTGAYFRDPNVPYRLMRAEALRKALALVPPDFDIQNVALSLAFHKIEGIRWKFVPIHFRARSAGENSINYKKIARMGMRMLREIRNVR
jgi:glycosyltransferase involved in cell wall biosynthesis